MSVLTEHSKVTDMLAAALGHVATALKEIKGVGATKVPLFAGDAAVQYVERLTSPHQLRLVAEGSTGKPVA